MEFIQAAWSLKMRSLTEQVYVDEVDNDEEGIAEMLLDENTVANITRPGTSLKQPGTGQGVPSQGVRSEAVNFFYCFHFHVNISIVYSIFMYIGYRPMSQSGRPLSGFARPGTQSARPGTMEQAIRTPRTSHTARPVTSASGRYVRLGTVIELYFIRSFRLSGTLHEK
jgi:tetratricopeptide repeat protein 8